MTENETILQPVYYTSHEGGKWIPWPENFELRADHLEARDRNNVVMRSALNMSLFVHSIAFDNPIENAFDRFRRWDCVNGWTRKN